MKIIAGLIIAIVGLIVFFVGYQWFFNPNSFDQKPKDPNS